jgi:hypothetical protein
VLGRSRWVPPAGLHAGLLAEIYRQEASIAFDALA